MKRERLIALAAGSAFTPDEVREMAAELLRILEPLVTERTLTLPHNRTDTSVAAAESMRHQAVDLRRIIYEWVAKQGTNGATCDEIENNLSIAHQTASARVHELWTGGQLIRTLVRRDTRSGRAAAVYVVDRHAQLDIPRRVAEAQQVETP